MALVRSYIAAIDAADWEGAYALLHEDYQGRHPFDRWVRGYGPVLGAKVRALQSVKSGPGQDTVHAGLTITHEARGGPRYSDWEATYVIVEDTGRTPHDRSILDVRMRRIGVG
jgi:hypothetical protein